MAAGLALARASVETGTETLTGVGVVSRGNVVRAYRGQTVVATMEGVTAVQAVARRQWKVVGQDGEWLVTRSGGCGCGGSR